MRALIAFCLVAGATIGCSEEAKEATAPSPVTSRDSTPPSAAGAGSASSPSASSSSAGAPVVTIDLLGATILPYEIASKQTWDPNSVSSNVPDALVRAIEIAYVGATPFIEVAKVLGDLVAQGWSAPDVIGSAALYVGPQAKSEQALTGEAHQFAPTIKARWEHVTLDEHVRIRVHLVDQDFGTLVNLGLDTDDPIGTIELNDTHLSAALKAKEVFHVPVKDQGTGQILFVDVSVIRE